jgi:ectoine utilization protein EutC
MAITLLNEGEIRSSVQMDQAALEVVAEGFSSLAAGKVSLPPIMRIDIDEHHGEVDVKSAYIQGLDSFAIKIASGFPENRLQGLPTGSGMMILISARTGRPLAVLLDNGYLTDVRTGIAGALAAKYLAPESVQNAGVIGSGVQARFQMQALKLVRDYQKLFVYGIDSEQVRLYIQEMGELLGVEVIRAESPELVVRECQVVVTATPSRQPYLQADWLHPGLHITCMGSDAEHKQELHPEVFKHTDVIACDHKMQVFRLGELHHARQAGIITDENEVVELGELTSGMKPGRQNDDQITICDLTGVGVQDTQIARLAYQEAVKKDLGLKI